MITLRLLALALIWIFHYDENHRSALSWRSAAGDITAGDGWPAKIPASTAPENLLCARTRRSTGLASIWRMKMSRVCAASGVPAEVA